MHSFAGFGFKGKVFSSLLGNRQIQLHGDTPKRLKTLNTNQNRWTAETQGSTTNHQQKWVYIAIMSINTTANIKIRNPKSSLPLFPPGVTFQQNDVRFKSASIKISEFSSQFLCIELIENDQLTTPSFAMKSEVSPVTSSSNSFTFQNLIKQKGP